MVKKDAAAELDEQRLDQESTGSVRKREIAVRGSAEGNSVGIFQNVAKVPQNGKPGILPDDDRGGAQEEEQGCGPVPHNPALSVFGFQTVL